MENCPSLWMVKRGRSVKHSNEEYGDQKQRDCLHPQPPAILPDTIVGDVAHDHDAHSKAADDDYLHHLPPLLEILSQHQHEAVPCHAHPNCHYDPVADPNLVELGCKGGKEATKGNY